MFAVFSRPIRCRYLLQLWDSISTQRDWLQSWQSSMRHQFLSLSSLLSFPICKKRILACLQKYEVGTFDDFCSEFGYNDRPLSEYPKVHKIWQAVESEFDNVKRLFSEEEIEELQEIQ